MRNLIGLGLTILGIVLFALTNFAPLIALLFVGVFLFASFPAEANFIDYRIANSNTVLFRKRYYINFLPFHLVSYVLTLGRAPLRIPWKEEYFTAELTTQNEISPVKITRKEYLALRKEQREIYSTQILSRAFMEESYSVADIGLKRKKNRLIAAAVLAGLMLTMLTVPDGAAMTLIYEAVFLPMVFLWIPNYKDAKILQQAYDRALAADPQP